MNNQLFTTTYGYQLNTFDRDGEILESAFPFEDFPMSLTATAEGALLAGGRGAFLSLFHIRAERPFLVETVRFT